MVKLVVAAPNKYRKSIFYHFSSKFFLEKKLQNKDILYGKTIEDFHAIATEHFSCSNRRRIVPLA